jgi:maleamate amidohydrolase
MSGDLNTGAIPTGVAPALIIVDMSYGFTSVESPLGGNFAKQIASNNQLIALFEQANRPIFCSTVVYDNANQASVFRSRLPDLNMLQRDSKWVAIDLQLHFSKPYTLVEKQLPSAFFATDLAKRLAALKVDSCVVTGLTTSGCVRATAVDALQYNFSTYVVSDACGDRNHNAHLASLHDINAKYGQVLSIEECKRHFFGVSDDQ